MQPRVRRVTKNRPHPFPLLLTELQRLPQEQSDAGRPLMRVPLVGHREERHLVALPQSVRAVGRAVLLAKVDLTRLALRRRVLDHAGQRDGRLLGQDRRAAVHLADRGGVSCRVADLGLGK